MREFRSYGSVRGALGNGRPYREHRAAASERSTLYLVQKSVAETSATRLSWPLNTKPWISTTSRLRGSRFPVLQ